MRASSELASSTFLRRRQSPLLSALAKAIAVPAAFLINWAINVPKPDSFEAMPNLAKTALPLPKTGQFQNSAYPSMASD
jgi:hypothetical protein